MAANAPKIIQTYFFIESHPKSINNDVEIVLDIKHSSIQPLRKLLEKDFKSSEEQEDFVVSVYAGDIISSLLKEKEIKTVNGIKTFPVKIIQKVQKNKFPGTLYPYLLNDTFINFTKFEIMKKIIGKNIDPPKQIVLYPYQYMTLFSEALLIKERIKINDKSYLELLRFGMNILKNSGTVPFKLFLMIYEKILNSGNIELLHNILDYFYINKIEQPNNLEELNIFEEPLMLIYGDSTIIVENIKMIPNVNFEFYLIKFYTVNILYHYIKKDFEKDLSVIIELRDNNPFDKLILAKLYLSEFNPFYQSLPITQEIKLSLIDSFIQASPSYEKLQLAFSMIKEYVQGDLNNILSIVINNYEKINQICLANKRPFKINDYIIQKYDDDLTKVQNSLITIGQNKLSKGFKAIDFRIDMWDLYLNEGKNPEFLEFLKSDLIQTSLYCFEITDSLSYIIKYTRKNLVTMLELFVKNYDKIEDICIAEKKYINVIDYLIPDEKDNYDLIQKNLDYIIARKMKRQYETFYFKIDIWLFYINNDFNNEFLNYLESKLFEGILYHSDVLDFLRYCSELRNRDIVPVLEMIIKYYKKIYIFTKKEKTEVDFSKYFDAKINTDNIEQIYKLICQIIEEERLSNYNTIKFKTSIWEPYSNVKNLIVLRYIRKIIIQCYIMDITVNEAQIDLGRKIHDVGFLYIRQGKLTGDKLLEFLGFEEAFYVEGQIDDIIETNKDQQRQLDEHLKNIKYLYDENNKMKARVSNCENNISRLWEENNRLVNRVNGLSSDVSSLRSRVSSLERDVNSLS